MLNRDSGTTVVEQDFGERESGMLLYSRINYTSICLVVAYAG